MDSVNTISFGFERLLASALLELKFHSTPFHGLIPQINEIQIIIIHTYIHKSILKYFTYFS